MTVKQTPLSFRPPIFSGNIEMYLTDLASLLSSLVLKIRNDFDNGAMTLPIIDIAGIAVGTLLQDTVTEFDEGQMKLYVDTSDSNAVYHVARVNDVLVKVALT